MTLSALQERNSELREHDSFILDSLYLPFALDRDTISLPSLFSIQIAL